MARSKQKLLAPISKGFNRHALNRFVVSVAVIAILAGCVGGPDANTRYLRAVDIYERGQPNRAASEFLELTKLDHPGAQYYLGLIYENGTVGIEQDIVRAGELFALAATQGDAGAQDALGHMYLYGTSFAKDEVEAARWLRLAAVQGRPEAQLSLAGLYSGGGRVRQDLLEAYMWYSVAIRHLKGEKLETAIFDRQILHEFMTATELKKAEARAQTWRPKTKLP